ncbi:hypothetical protein BDAP_000883 [Binucleata daphniae]
MLIILTLYFCRADTPKRIPIDIPVTISPFQKEMYLTSENDEVGFRNDTYIADHEKKVVIIDKNGRYQIKIDNNLLCHSSTKKTVVICTTTTLQSSYWEVEPHDKNIFTISVFDESPIKENLCLTYEKDAILTECKLADPSQYMVIMPYEDFKRAKRKIQKESKELDGKNNSSVFNFLKDKYNSFSFDNLMSFFNYKQNYNNEDNAVDNMLQTKQSSNNEQNLNQPRPDEFTTKNNDFNERDMRNNGQKGMESNNIDKGIRNDGIGNRPNADRNNDQKEVRNDAMANRTDADRNNPLVQNNDNARMKNGMEDVNEKLNANPKHEIQNNGDIARANPKTEMTDNNRPNAKNGAEDNNIPNPNRMHETQNRNDKARVNPNNEMPNNNRPNTGNKTDAPNVNQRDGTNDTNRPNPRNEMTDDNEKLNANPKHEIENRNVNPDQRNEMADNQNLPNPRNDNYKSNRNQGDLAGEINPLSNNDNLKMNKLTEKTDDNNTEQDQKDSKDKKICDEMMSNEIKKKLKIQGVVDFIDENGTNPASAYGKNVVMPEIKVISKPEQKQGEKGDNEYEKTTGAGTVPESKSSNNDTADNNPDTTKNPMSTPNKDTSNPQKKEPNSNDQLPSNGPGSSQTKDANENDKRDEAKNDEPENNSESEASDEADDYSESEESDGAENDDELGKTSQLKQKSKDNIVENKRYHKLHKKQELTHVKDFRTGKENKMKGKRHKKSSKLKAKKLKNAKLKKKVKPENVFYLDQDPVKGKYDTQSLSISKLTNKANMKEKRRDEDNERNAQYLFNPLTQLTDVIDLNKYENSNFVQKKTDEANPLPSHDDNKKNDDMLMSCDKDPTEVNNLNKGDPSSCNPTTNPNIEIDCPYENIESTDIKDDDSSSNNVYEVNKKSIIDCIQKSKSKEEEKCKLGLSNIKTYINKLNEADCVEYKIETQK